MYHRRFVWYCSGILSYTRIYFIDYYQNEIDRWLFEHIHAHLHTCIHAHITLLHSAHQPGCPCCMLRCRQSLVDMSTLQLCLFVCFCVVWRVHALPNAPVLPSSGQNQCLSSHIEDFCICCTNRACLDEFRFMMLDPAKGRFEGIYEGPLHNYLGSGITRDLDTSTTSLS